MGTAHVMSDSSPSIHLSELLEHSSWVRDLSRRLARDPGSADDLAQATWLAALENPPRAGRPVRQWLGTVVRNFALQSRRSESRRAEREARAARPEPQPSTGELLERASMQRQVADAVMELDEPYRTAILLRYFEDLPPREIGRRLGVPVETVRTRIGRGVERLRQKLDRDHGGDRRAWSMALLPIADRPWGVAPSALGVAVVNMKIVASVLTVSALGVGAWYVAGRGAAPAEPEVAAAAPGAAEPVEPELVRAAPPGETRVRAEPAVRGTPPGTAGREAEPLADASGPLAGVVLAAAGHPLAGVTVELEAQGPGESYLDPGGEPAGDTVRATSQADGRFTFDPAPERGRLAAADESYTTVLASYYKQDQASDPVVVVAERRSLAGTAVDDAGYPVEGAHVSVVLPERFRSRFDVVLDRSQLATWQTGTDEAGRFELPDAPGVEGARFRVTRDGFVPHEVALPAISDTNMRITLVPRVAGDGVVRGRVVDASGAGVAGAYVALGVDTTATDADGGFSLALDDPEGFSARFGFPTDSLTALKAGFLPATWAPPVEKGAPVWPQHVTLVLAGEAFTLAGRVVDHRGDPLDDAIVWLADTTLFGAVGGRPRQTEHMLAGGGGSSWQSVAVDEAGRFELRGLLDRDYLVRAMDPETLLFDEFGPFAAGARDVRIQLPTDRLYERVTGRVVSFDGRPIAGASIFPMCDAFQARAQGQIIGTSHQSLDGTTTDEQGHFELRNVPKTLVYLRVQGESILPREYGRFVEGDPRFDEVDLKGLPGDEIERLEIEVEQRCHLQVELADPTAADEVTVLDGEGRALVLNVMMARGRREHQRMPLHEGRSDTLAVSDTGRTLVLFLEGEEIGRMPISLAQGEVTTITF